jgi:8-oxo-dGTP pyrophosphatase MutT (NUDIX family)
VAWPVVASRVVYDNPWIEVREDDVVRPDGSPGLYGVVRVRQPAVFVVALTDADEVVLVSVDRHTVGTSLEVPAGGSDGESPRTAAERELREETGLVAAEWTELGRLDALNGICEAVEHVFLARGLSAINEGDEGDGRVEEGITEVRRVPLAETLDLVRSGRIRDGETVAALMLALLHLDRVH